MIASNLISWTEEGIEIDFNSIHLSKAESPIVIRFDGSWNDTLSKFEHPLNACPPIVLTEEGIEIEILFFL